MRKIYLSLLFFICVLVVNAQVTVDILPKSTPFGTGSVNSTGTKNDGNMTTINSTTNRGWAAYDLSSLPAGAIVNSAKITFTTYSSTSSTAANDIFGFTGDPSTIAGATLYTNCGGGSTLLNGTWTANATNGPSTLNAAGVTFISNNLGNANVCLGFVRGSTNTYNIYGYSGTTAQQPKLTITYTTVACANPNNIAASSITTNSATISWSASPSTPTGGYQYEVRTSGAAGSGAAGLAASGNTAAGVLSANVSTLTANTIYSVYVRSNCGANGFSVWSSAYNFTTACGVSSVPYTQDFESVTVPGFPACTSTENAGSGNNWVTVSNPGVGFTTKALKYGYNSTNAANAWFYTPALNLNGGTSYRLSFKYGNNDVTYTEKLEVKYGAAAASGSMSNLIVDYPSINQATLQLSSTDFTPSSTGVYYIGFHVYSDADQWNLYVDDISVIITPSCNEPTGIVLSNLTPTGAQVDWTTPSSGTPVNYQIYYSTTNTAPTGSSTPNVTGLTGTTTNLTGLTAATTYYLWMRTFCGGSNYSSWSALPVTFTTPCTSVTTFPYLQDFNAATLPVCWATQVTSGTANWQVGTSSAGGDISSGVSASGFVSKIYTTSTANLISAPMNLAALGSNPARISLYIYRHASTVQADVVNVYVNNAPNTSGGTNILAIHTLTTEAPTVPSSGWYKYTADIPVSYNTSGTIYFVVEGITTAGFSSYDLGIDNFTVEQTPSCNEPTAVIVSNIGTTTAQVDWTPPTVGTPASYQLYYSTTNTAPIGSTTPTVTGATGTTKNLTGLTAGTTYYLWVRSFCGGTDVSAWSTSATFTTLCNAVTTFTENFDAVTTPALPNCWAKVGTTGLANTQTASNFSSPNCLYIYSGSGTDQAVVSMPPVSNLAAATHRLKFKARGNFTAGADIEVGYLTDPSNASTFTNIQTINASTLTYQDFEVIPPSIPGATVLAFRHAGNVAYSALIDNVIWEAIPTCDVPSALLISNISTTTADLDWTPPTIGSPVNYQVYVSTSNTAPTGSTTPTFTGAASPFTITGLTANTTYYVWVRTNCGGGNTSSWSTSVIFATACNATSVPYTQNFESVTVPNLPSCTSSENAGTGNNWVTVNNPGSGFTTNALKYGYNTANAANAWFYTQGLNLTGGTSYRITFKYGNNSTTYAEKLEVKYGSSPSSGSMSDLIVDYQTINQNALQLSSTDFTPSATGVYYIGFHAYSIANQFNLYVDDISVTITPTCESPTGLTASNITTSSAQIDWVAPTVSSPVSYQAYYNTTGVAPIGSTVPTVRGLTGLSANITGLTPSTTYYLWLRSSCGGSDTSAWTSSSVTFATACTVTSAPYTQDFESATVPNLPICTAKENAGTGNNWTIASNPGSGFTTKTLQYVYNSTSAANAWFFTRGLNLTGGTTYRLIFRYGNNSSTYVEKLKVNYGTSATSADMTNLIVDYPSITGATAATSSTTFIPPTTGVYYLGFNAYSAADQWNLYVDDITLSVSTLPVTILSFRGEKTGEANRLLWSTSTETNNRGFELERSADGKNFTALTFVSTKSADGNSNTKLDYSYIDAKPLGGNNYYRLKQVDRDGKFSYSDIVLLKSKISEIMISSLYPNPAKDELNLMISSPSAEKLTIVLTDLSGKVVMQKVAAIAVGDNQQQLNVSSLAAGTYVVKAICANGCETAVHRFVKQ